MEPESSLPDFWSCQCCRKIVTDNVPSSGNGSTEGESDYRQVCPFADMCCDLSPFLWDIWFHGEKEKPNGRQREPHLTNMHSFFFSKAMCDTPTTPFFWKKSLFKYVELKHTNRPDDVTWVKKMLESENELAIKMHAFWAWVYKCAPPVGSESADPHSGSSA